MESLNKKLCATVCAGALLATAPAWGQEKKEAEAPAEQARAITFLIQTHVENGGDELVRKYFPTQSSAHVNAGALIHFNIGLAFNLFADTHPDWETRFTVGMKTQRQFDSNGQITFRRYPFELLQYVRKGKWHVGGGLTYHYKPQLDGTAFGTALGTVAFSDALGIVMAADYPLPNDVFLGGRATLIQYSGGNDTVNGSSLGITIGLRI